MLAARSLFKIFAVGFIVALAIKTCNGQELVSDDLDDISLIGRDPRLIYNHVNIPVIRRADVSIRSPRPAPLIAGQRIFSRLADGSRSSHSSFLPERSSPSQGLYWMRNPAQFAASAESSGAAADDTRRMWRVPTAGRSRSHPPLWALLSPRRVRGLQYDFDY
ncbi:uncharacterized protein LOC129597025 [Paramacrobiotus metropolitanus]|uniref:uncharacterized protein LOC129597025 n=1 Tax=Paramacrobiotus metropolitanus TaxID=2943436 RepID=UPI00244560EC|nr:uncharacterized protein LOC129597025 [Paramacrobiotus metropolitanus]